MIDSPTRALLWTFALIVPAYAAIIVGFGPSRAAMHDETHFIRTIRLFDEQPTLETLRTYNEMSTPLPFALYAAWGRVAGFKPVALRVLSWIIAAGGYAAICLFLHAQFRDARVAAGMTVMMALHPYMIALSVLVYTDMLAIGLCAAACYALLRRHAVLIGMTLAGALLCRQYAIVFPIAFALYLLLERGERWRAMLAVIGLSLLPAAALFAWWGGLSPDNGTAARFAGQSMAWHPSSAVLYVAIAAVYLAPLLVVRAKATYGRPKVMTAALILGAAYWLFPVRPSAVFYQPTRVGLFDALLHRVFDNVAMRDMVFCFAFMLGLPIVFAAWREVSGFAMSLPRRRESSRGAGDVQLDSRLHDARAAWALVLLAFVAIMPMSYLHWEKYFMLIYPAACALVWSQRREAMD